MTPNEKREVAVHIALKSIEDCQRNDPVAPALSAEDELVCRGKTRRADATGDRHG